MLTEQAKDTWSLEVPMGTTEADLSNPKLYTEIQSRLSLMGKKPFQFPRIQVTDVEGSFFADVVVTGNAKGIVTTQVLSFVQVGEVVAEDETEDTSDETDDTDTTDGSTDTDDSESESDKTEDSTSEDEEVDSADAKGTVSFEERFALAKDQTQAHFIKHRGAGKWSVINRKSAEAVESELTKEQAVEAHSKYMV